MRDFFRETDPLERARLRVVLLTVVVSVVSVSVFAGKSWSDGRTATLLSAINAALFAAHILWYRDAGMARLLLWGLCLGTVELIADALCVRFTGTLDYSVAYSAYLAESPWWMPVAWALVGAQIGYLGARFVERVGVLRGAALSALIGAVNIPFYEEMAFHAHWWQYQFCRMLPGSHTPIYIVIAELVIGGSLAPLARIALRNPRPTVAVAAGAAAGVFTIIGGLVGFGIAEGMLP